MQISFTTRAMEKTCSSQKEMVKAFGAEGAKKLMQRLMELMAAPDMSCLPPQVRCHPLTGNLKGKYAVDLKHPFRLVFEPFCEELPVKDDGSLDIQKVTGILVTEIIDYH
jgi:proteic killer suppression protein